MDVFAVYDHYSREDGNCQITDIDTIYLGVDESEVKAKVHDDNTKVGGGIAYDEISTKVICGDEVLTLFDDISLLEELKRRKLIQMEGIKALIKQMEESIVKKKYEIPAGGISERQVLEVFRLQDAYYAGMNGDEFELSPQEYVIKHWNK